ncbi:MAG: hypothetical protein ABSF37_08160 [Sedimentisphaerales bacterium]|jgi:hypothetical protein
MTQHQHLKGVSIGQKFLMEKLSSESRIGAVERKTEVRRRMTENRKEPSSVIRQLQGPKKAGATS